MSALVPLSPTPSVHVPDVPFSLTQPATPLSCVSAPVVPSRASTVTALLTSAAAYTVAPSGLTATYTTSFSPFPSAHVTPSPVSARQPAVPLNCVSAPVVVFRANTATAELPADPT